MKSLEECEAYFKSYISSQAQAAETHRKNFVGYWRIEMTRTLMISAVIIVVGVTAGSYIEDDGSLGFLLLKSAPVIGSIIWILIKMFTLGFKYLGKLDEFRRYYRENITQRMLKFMVPDLTYKPEEGIDTEIIESSMIVPIYFTHSEFSSKYLLESHDLLEGDFNGVDAKTSMISLERRADRVQCDPAGGLFFRAKLEKEFEGSVVIRREFTEKYLGKALSNFVDDIRTSLGDNSEKNYFDSDENKTDSAKWQSLERYNVENQEFENYYRVKTSDPQLAKSLLTDKRISNMLDIATAGDLLVQFAFHDSYFSAYFFRDNAHLFDVAIEDVNKKVNNFDHFSKLHHELGVVNLMAQGIVKESA